MRVLDLTTNQREGAPNVTGKDVFVSILPVYISRFMLLTVFLILFVSVDFISPDSLCAFLS